MKQVVGSLKLELALFREVCVIKHLEKLSDLE
jgi:hypothetical protein